MTDMEKRKTIPMPPFGIRLVFYLAAVVFAVLSCLQAADGRFGMILGVGIYVLAAVMLAVSCCYLVLDIRYGIKEKVKPGIEANPFANRMTKDYHYRTVMFAFPGLVLNMAFVAFNGAVGILSRSAWCGTLCAYYIVLSMMRFGAVRCDQRMAGKKEEVRREAEISFYRRCGIWLTMLTIALAGTVILILHEEGGKQYPGYLIYAVAGYTFYKIIMSVVNLRKVRRFRSPLLMAIRDIGYVDALVSVLSLQTAMFASFGKGEPGFDRLMNGTVGTAVCLMVFGAGIRCIRQANRMKRELEMQAGRPGF